LTRWVVRHPYIAEGVVLAWIVAFIFLLCDQKSRLQPSIVYPTWLAFFFAFCISAEILIYSGMENLFDANGNPVNGYGKMIFDGINFFLDIKSETILFGVVFFTLAVPQGLAYLAAGVSGSAREVRFVAFAWKIIASLTAKSFISAAAVAMSISLVGNHYGWVRGDPKNILADLSIFLLLFSYGLVLLFFSIPSGKKKNLGKNSSKLQRWIAWIHGKMTRRMAAVSEGEMPEAKESISGTAEPATRAELIEVSVLIRREQWNRLQR
jgi:hypothetical protein